MKLINVCLYVTGLLSLQHVTFAQSCEELNPQGADAVIRCAALENGFASAADFWNKKLFSPTVLDTYCTSTPVNLTTAQRELFTLSCAREAGAYFSYDKFIAADTQMKNALGDKYNFMRNGSYAVNVAELANFLATAAQETTGNGLLPDKYQQDGLHFRSEYSFLAADTCYRYPENPNWDGESGRSLGQNCGTLGLDHYYTNYYPISSYAVPIQAEGSPILYTKFLMDLDAQYSLDTTPLTVSFPGKPTLYAGGTYAPPEGTVWAYMNQTLKQGYWIGQGNLQLTAVSMNQFFGWYYQNLAEGAPQDFANYNDFVERYVGDGQLAWLGGLFYWNVRVNGYLKPTLHAVLTGAKDACHDIGLTTFLINGGCNHAEQRVLYYKYFKTGVFKQSSSGVSYTYQGQTSNSMVCSANLAAYCTAP